MIAEAAAKGSKVLTQKCWICLSARLERVDIADFDRIFTRMALQWSLPLVSSEKHHLNAIRHFPTELWPKKSEFSRFFRPSDTECLSYFHTPGIAGGSLLFFSTVASRPDVYNAHWMVAVRFFNLEFGSIKFLTSRVQDIQNSESNFLTVSNTLDGNTGVRAAIHVCTTGIGRFGVVRSAVGYSEWE